MKIGIYSGFWGWLGGGQNVVGTMAEGLSRHHSVEIVHHRPDASRRDMEEGMALDLGRVDFRYSPEPVRQASKGLNPWRRFQQERDIGAELSEPYELFINASDLVPVFSHAPRSVLFTSFPFTDPDHFFGRLTEQWRRRPSLVRIPWRLYQDFEWARRFGTYQVCVTSSQFSKAWLKRRWGVDASVAYPSGRADFTIRPKDNLILSIGRFQVTETGHGKKHGALIDAFKNMCDAGLRDWELVLVGGVRAKEENFAYLQSLRDRMAGYPIRLAVNATGAELTDLCERSSLFWHATGFGEDAVLHPARMEHFGIVTVEAMAAGIVPIVFNGGGQPEIVRDQQDGFLWNTLRELEDTSWRLIKDRTKLDAFGAAARERSHSFSRANYFSQLATAIRPLLDGPAPDAPARLP